MFLKIFNNLLLTLDRFKQRKNMLNDLKTMASAIPEDCTHEIEGEKEWINKWKVFNKKVSPLAYRIYTNFIGRDINILPCDVSRIYIEPILNPEGTRCFYSDKNSLGILLDENDMPKTLFRSMSYTYYDNDYEPVLKSDFFKCFDGYDKLIVKSATGLGGYSVKLFKRTGDKFLDDNDNEMTLDYLEKIYNTNFLIQEVFVQSDFMSQFNPSSVNTLRVNTYRDVDTGEVHFLGAVMKIGSKGAVVDNASSGGVFIGVDENGKLQNQCIDTFGIRTNSFNGIDFTDNEFVIPNYDEIKKFAIKVSKRFPHVRLFAHDIALDKNNHPKIIEVNVDNFTDDFLQSTQGAVFGKYTDSIINYCLSKKSKITAGIRKNLI